MNYIKEGNKISYFFNTILQELSGKNGDELPSFFITQKKNKDLEETKIITEKDMFQDFSLDEYVRFLNIFEKLNTDMWWLYTISIYPYLDLSKEKKEYIKEYHEKTYNMVMEIQKHIHKIL